MENANFKWFKHSVTATLELPVNKIVKHLGYHGLGVFWTLVERLSLFGGRMPYADAERLFVSKQFVASKLVELIDDYGVFCLDRYDMIRFTDAFITWMEDPTQEWCIDADEDEVTDGEETSASGEEMSASGEENSASGEQMSAKVEQKSAKVEQNSASGEQTTSKARVRLEREKEKDKEKEKKKHTQRNVCVYEFSDSDSQEVKEFKLQMKTYYPRLCRMRSPLTFGEMGKLKKLFPTGLIKQKLMDLENYQKLYVNYVSAYLTLRQWCQKEIDNPQTLAR